MSGFRFYTYFISLFISLQLFLISATAQTIYESKNGYNLPAHGTIRIAVILIEVNYSSTIPDPTGKGWKAWPAHHLPDWADNSDPLRNAFDYSDSMTKTSGVVSLYYEQASLGNFHVIADYLKAPDNGGIFSVDSEDGVVSPGDAIKAVNKKLGNSIETLHGLNDISFFNKWILSSPGLPKTAVTDLLPETPAKWDHVMIIWRNNQGKRYNSSTKQNEYNMVTGNGYCSAGSPGTLLGYDANTFSNFSIYGELNSDIIRHEFAHMIYGGNNFHVAGGGAGDPNYWIPKISGYSNLSLYDATLACWNGWDRQRLDWKAKENQFSISVRDPLTLKEVNADLDAASSDHERNYLLRDFITTGDALRIKLPFTDSGKEYNEYLWIENHNGRSLNNSPFDRWFYDGNSCITQSAYGLYMYLQIDKYVNASSKSNDLFGGYCDFLRMISADGFYDRVLDSLTIPEECLGKIPARPFQRKSDLQNSLTGGGDNDMISVDLDKDHRISAGDQYVNDIENVNGNYRHDFVQNGNNRQVFTKNGNKKIGIDTNPSTATSLNLVSYNSPVSGTKNIRRTYLNGISVEIISQDDSGNIIVKVRFDDTDLNNDVRWCSPEIVVNPVANASYSLNLKKNKKMTLDLGLTPTRMDKPMVIGGKEVFTDRTKMILNSGSIMNLDTSANVMLKNESIFQLNSGSQLEMKRKASVIVSRGCRLVVSGKINIAGGEITVDEGGILEFHNGGEFHFYDKKAILKMNGILLVEKDSTPPFETGKKRQKNIRLGRKFSVENIR